MAIEMRLDEELNSLCPVVVCDVCKKEIERAGDGNVQWTSDEEILDGSKAYFTHKKVCSDQLPGKLHVSDASWDDLQALPIRLAINLGLSVQKIEGDIWSVKAHVVEL